MKRKIIFLGLAMAVFALQPVFAGKTEKIKMENIRGEAIGTEDETLKQVREKAINNAKLEALRKAGISENINSYSNMFKYENTNKYEEMFTADIFSSINGEVIVDEIINDQKDITSEGLQKVVVFINCTVIKYETNSDLTFSVEISGIEKFYKHESGLIYKVKPAKNCYMRAFLISNISESNMLFPSEHETDKMLEKDKEYTFPDQNLFENYTLTTDKGNEEAYRLILVFVKEDIRFLDVTRPKTSEDKEGMKLLSEVSYKTVASWIFKIPPDQRLVQTFSFTVVK